MKFLTAALLALSTVLVSAAQNATAGTCKNPIVHVEWRSLNQTQRDSYHEAVKCLRGKTSHVKGQTMYSQYTSVHDKVFARVHYVAQFLPWHRWFLWLRRLDLQDCGYTGPSPYWDWTIDSHKPIASEIWDPVTGFGGNGNTHTEAHCVENGPYANLQLTVPNKHCLPRQFNNGNPRRIVIGRMQGAKYSAKVVKMILENEHYDDFLTDLEGIPHDAIHSAISGDMAVSFSPNDPLFFLHHQNVDRIWAKWQGRGPRLHEFAGNTVQEQSPTNGTVFPLATLHDIMPTENIRGLPNLRVVDVMDTLSDTLCYTVSRLLHFYRVWAQADCCCIVRQTISALSETISVLSRLFLRACHETTSATSYEHKLVAALSEVARNVNIHIPAISQDLFTAARRPLQLDSPRLVEDRKTLQTKYAACNSKNYARDKSKITPKSPEENIGDEMTEQHFELA
ncbi:hypothetical protein FRC10_012014, partial [Ceratobasidium sp. 414]